MNRGGHLLTSLLAWGLICIPAACCLAWLRLALHKPVYCFISRKPCSLAPRLALPQRSSALALSARACLSRNLLTPWTRILSASREPLPSHSSGYMELFQIHPSFYENHLCFFFFFSYRVHFLPQHRYLGTQVVQVVYHQRLQNSNPPDLVRTTGRGRFIWLKNTVFL